MPLRLVHVIHGLAAAASCMQSSSQSQLLAQQQARLSDLEGSVRQWEERCADLRDLVAGHEGRCKEATAEVMKGNEVIEKLQVSRSVVQGVTGTVRWSPNSAMPKVGLLSVLGACISNSVQVWQVRCPAYAHDDCNPLLCSRCTPAGISCPSFCLCLLFTAVCRRTCAC
jgi:hypothetical protein